MEIWRSSDTLDYIFHSFFWDTVYIQLLFNHFHCLRKVPWKTIRKRFLKFIFNDTVYQDSLCLDEFIIYCWTIGNVLYSSIYIAPSTYFGSISSKKRDKFWLNWIHWHFQKPNSINDNSWFCQAPIRVFCSVHSCMRGSHPYYYHVSTRIILHFIRNSSTRIYKYVSLPPHPVRKCD